MPILTKDQLNSFLSTLEEKSDVIGVLLTGSYAYGKPNDTSDIDIVCTIEGGEDYAEFDRMVHDVPANIFYNVPETIYDKYWKQAIKEGHGDSVHFWANGKIVYDPKGIVAKLQQEARRLWKQQVDSGKEWEWRWEKHKGGYAKQHWEKEL